MFDTLSIARRLTEAGVNREQADVMADAIRQAAEHGDYVTTEQFNTGIAELSTEIASQINVLTWRIVGIVGLAVAVLRWLG